MFYQKQDVGHDGVENLFVVFIEHFFFSFAPNRWFAVGVTPCPLCVLGIYSRILDR